MAGIGFALRDLARGRDTLSAGVGVYGHAAFVSCGPWLFTVLALTGVGMLGHRMTGVEELPRFTVVVIYNFAFSLVLAGPVVLVITRRLADMIFIRSTGEVPGMLVGSLTVLFAVQAAVAIPFYGVAVDLEPAERLAAIAGFLVVGGIWVTTAFLSALRSFETISMAFAAGMAAALALAVALGHPYGVTGMLAGFTLGLALTFHILLARILAEYPYPLARPFAFLTDVPRHWELALAGLFYNAGIWVDKWIMWLAPGNEVFAGAMPAHASYDAAMFLAFLTIVPAMTLFLVTIETRFFEDYRRFYRDIGSHATIAEIRRNHQALVRILTQSSRNVAILQLSVCYVALLTAPRLIEMVGGGPELVPIFRFGVLGALFHALVLFTMVILSYFDLRRVLLSVTVAFFLLNATLTCATLWLGQGYYGYGYFLAAMACAVYAYAAAARRIVRLPYMTFVANNRNLH